MKKRVNTYLAIALTTYCNFQCFYCKEGGEPTSVLYFSELIEYIMSFKSTRVRINTNGYKILNYIDILVKYKERIDIVFSVDSISEYLSGVHFQKFLSDDVIKITKLLQSNDILVRYNIVVTSLNECEIKNLVLKAIDELNVNVKLLDLNKFSEYLGYDNPVSGEAAFSLWRKLFVPMNKFYDFLEKISNNSESEWTTGLIAKGHGIPMSSYFRGKNWIQVKDSMKGAKYFEICVKECPFYQTGNCQEGVFSLFLSSNLMLHLSGCKNSSIHFNLNGCDDNQIKTALRKC